MRPSNEPELVDTAGSMGPTAGATLRREANKVQLPAANPTLDFHPSG